MRDLTIILDDPQCHGGHRRRKPNKRQRKKNRKAEARKASEWWARVMANHLRNGHPIHIVIPREDK